MHPSSLLLTAISFHALFCNTFTFRTKVGKDDEIDELGDDITFYHRNLGLKFETLGFRRRKPKGNFIRFPAKVRKFRCSSKRCFPNMPYGYGSSAVYHPYLSAWWPRGNALWPEYGWTDGCAYPFGGAYSGYGWGHGTWSHHYRFPTSSCCQSGCGQWCSKYNY